MKKYLIFLTIFLSSLFIINVNASEIDFHNGIVMTEEEFYGYINTYNSNMLADKPYVLCEDLNNNSYSYTCMMYSEPFTVTSVTNSTNYYTFYYDNQHVYSFDIYSDGTIDSVSYHPDGTTGYSKLNKFKKHQYTSYNSSCPGNYCTYYPGFTNFDIVYDNTTYHTADIAVYDPFKEPSYTYEILEKENGLELKFNFENFNNEGYFYQINEKNNPNKIYNINPPMETYSIDVYYNTYLE